MEITDIPFAQTIGLIKTETGVLGLEYDTSVMNHVQTVAAAAQFSLAELASGEHLQTLFPELIGKVLPVLRDTRLKFKKPAVSNVTAHPSASSKTIEKFRRQFESRGRGLITIEVDVQDDEGTVTSSGRFVWYIQVR